MTLPVRIAIFQPDPAIQLQRSLREQLSKVGAKVSCHVFSDDEHLRKALRRETFDLLLLNWNAADIGDLWLVHWLRTYQQSDIPILMLSARTSEHDVTSALMCGVDDYITVTQPFRPMELSARVMRLLQRARSLPFDGKQDLRYGRWGFDRLEQTVTLHQGNETDAPAVERHALTTREFVIARALFSQMGRVVSRAHLAELAGYAIDDLTTRSLDSHIYRLRKKLGLTIERGVSLKSLYGQGYCLEDRTAPADAPNDASHGQAP